MTKERRLNRVKRQIRGTTERPRLCVNISNKHVSAQIINDDSAETLAFSTSTVSQEKGSLTDKAEWVGADIAKKAKKAKIDKVVLDRRSRRYHGRVAALSESARKQGLEF